MWTSMEVIIISTAHKPNERRRLLCKVLQVGSFKSQKQVIDALAAKGYKLSQSEVSKDFKILGVKRTSDGFFYVPENTDNLMLSDLVGFYEISIEKTESLAKLKVCSVNTKKGHSELLAEKIEKYNFSTSKFNINLLPMTNSLLIFYEEDAFYDNMKSLFEGDITNK